MGWIQGKQGETKDSAKNKRIAEAAINQASAELGFTRPMVEIAYAQARARDWYAQFKSNKLDVMKDPNSGRRSLDDTYGFDRLRRLWRTAVKGEQGLGFVQGPGELEHRGHADASRTGEALSDAASSVVRQA
jgi:hypothetical protein